MPPAHDNADKGTHMNTAEVTVESIDEWITFDEAYESFVESHPKLGLGTGTWATVNLRRNYGERLLQSGTVIQLANRRWLAHRERFAPALFELLLRAPAEIVERAKARESST
jgi:hypothetical protein